jgi:hypothetical protein
METKPRVLLVDDEAAITGNLAPLLERAGFAVTVASDGEEALRQAGAFNPDLIITDVLMPRMDGRELLRRLRQSDLYRAVLGFNKTPALYGAFPTDPYSHTPWGAGARQPGMTGQVRDKHGKQNGKLGQ